MKQFFKKLNRHKEANVWLEVFRMREDNRQSLLSAFKQVEALDLRERSTDDALHTADDVGSAQKYSLRLAFSNFP